tara:strand:- start:18147 stop:18446 length:300 start_codon:yes stop_codon:yes gene_type:complete
MKVFPTYNSQSAIFAEVEIDVGTTPVIEASVSVTNALVTTETRMLGGVAYKKPTGKDLDEISMDSFDLKFEPLLGSFNVLIKGLEGYISDKFIIWYTYN